MRNECVGVRSRDSFIHWNLNMNTSKSKTHFIECGRYFTLARHISSLKRHAIEVRWGVSRRIRWMWTSITYSQIAYFEAQHIVLHLLKLINWNRSRKKIIESCTCAEWWLSKRENEKATSLRNKMSKMPAITTNDPASRYKWCHLLILWQYTHWNCGLASLIYYQSHKYALWSIQYASICWRFVFANVFTLFIESFSLSSLSFVRRWISF